MTAWTQPLEDYTAWLGASGASRTTLRLRRYYVTRLSLTYPGPWSVTAEQLVSYLSEPSWAPETRKSARSTLRGFYGWAMDTGRITVDPARSLPRVRVPAGVPRPAPQAVFAAALAHADERGRLMLLLAGLAGLRRAEVAAVHSRDVTPDLAGWSLRVHGKGGRVRTVPLHPALTAELSRCPEGYVFPGRINGHLSPDRVGKVLAGLLGRGWSGHTLRHAFATAAYAHERDLLATSRLLGHSKPETTSRYCQVPDDSLRSAVMSLPFAAPDRIAA